MERQSFSISGAFNHSIGSGEFLSPESSNGDANTNEGKNDRKNLERTLARKETAHIRRFRILTLLVHALFAVILSTLVYIYSKGVEENEFEKDFTSNGNKVIDAFSDDSYSKMQALFALSSSITSHALYIGAKWPFVTIPNSAAEFGPYLTLTDAAALTVFPIVPRHLRAEWEAYSVREQGWIDQDLKASLGQEEYERWVREKNAYSLAAAHSDENKHFDEDFHSISPFIKNYVGVDTSPGVWTPWWQYYPVIPNRWFVNFNRLASRGFKAQAETVMQGKATLSETTTFEPGLDFQSTRDFDFTNQLLQAGGSGQYDAGEPLSYISYPIFDRFDNNNHPLGASHSDGQQGSGKKTVAILSATVYWRSYFQGHLPDAVEGIVCVVSNSAGQAFTYQINGKEAVFLGMEDLHDSRFDDLRLTAEFAAFLEDASSGGTNTTSARYMGVTVDDANIAYKLEVYPSKTFENEHYTSNPIYFALAIAGVFVLCAIIFHTYNNLVERRQLVVMTTAVKSAAVVESIFPSNVRDRLMQQAAPDVDGVGISVDGTSTMPTEQKEKTKTNDQPIADFFNGCTVFFADIKGFTAWCDNREPVQVFTLLETLYKSFDEIAKRRHVYKVETVGDCYVAVTGLPQPQKDHFLAMAAFAKDARKKFFQVIQDLEDVLGEGTSQLGIRVGIHSGPVTAGVIRGDNARFQLFGDTVNTASRMESTSDSGKIQISETTASLLIGVGKSSWFIQREEKIFAKGKGEMQTYWLFPADSTSSSKEAQPLYTTAESRRVLESDGVGDEEEYNSGDMLFLEQQLRARIEEAHEPSAMRERA